MMGHHEKVEQIRSFVRETLIRLGAEQVETVSESMLIREGFFCGWRFTISGMEAIWFVEEAEIKFVDSNGAVLQVTDLTRSGPKDHAQRAA